MSPRTVSVEPVELDEDDFTEAVAKLAQEAHPSAQPQKAVRRLLPQVAEGGHAARAEEGPIIRVAPVEVTASTSRAEVELTREYLRWCQRAQGGGDCLHLLADGPTVRGDDRYALALALSLGSVLEETKLALKGMVEPSAVLAMLVWIAALYLLLWVLPEPVSKGIAAGLTVGLLAWLGVDTVWSLMRGWTRLVEDADRATSFDELSSAGENFGKVMGENTARVLVLLATAVLGGSVAKLAEKLPRLPGFAQASVQAEAQGGLRLATMAEVETVAASSEGTFSILTRSPGSAAGSRVKATTVIQHQGGNRQVLINGQRWHVPAKKPLKDIPATDPVGDQLQAAALRAAQRWGPHELRLEEQKAITQAVSRGEHWMARLLERQARGRFVERVLRSQFPQLRWNLRGVDVIDPSTGYKYELLSGTDSNLALHGQRMVDVLFRMITF
ncbi:hypothetical protein LXT23_05525 [Pyxidicoccus sp. QH1ED-7-1]|uniref:SitA5 family polymorphic toxin n=1 Tax=Pyxidicoccus xibeiensis TaxID=2906759 RepID=UPI0020A7D765|nr:hypothetical protein [Pyxidicoccus xibeiensis]MCP3136792.1 hypothetical protein [Pyxidicoccus xibeiensis]